MGGGGGIDHGPQSGVVEVLVVEHHRVGYRRGHFEEILELEEGKRILLGFQSEINKSWNWTSHWEEDEARSVNCCLKEYESEL